MKFSKLLSAAALLCSAYVSSSPITPTRVLQPRTTVPDNFVHTVGKNFVVNGTTFYFVGTNAYWLAQLNSDTDIVNTLTSIRNDGVRVVRTWCFNEVVGTPPAHGTWTSLWNNGQVTYSDAGFQRLEFILQTAQNLGMYIQCSLTNNWAPTFPANEPRPEGYYSNQYGGMDTYVQQLSPGGTHDLFYTDDTIKTAYKNFLNVIIPKLSSYSSLFSWEIANDPRCYGALDTTTSGSCTPQTITEWTSEVATFITTLDPNHMAASGDGGFYCTGCPKLFPVPAPQPQPSSGLRKRRRGTLAGTRRSPLTQADVLADMFEHEKRAALEGRAQAKPKSKKSIRGAWKAPGVASWSSFKRTTTVGPAYNGFHGVDTEDILGIPQVSYSSFQFFPDQNTYSADGQDTSTPPPGGAGGTNLAQTIQTGVTWITQHADSANTYGKPSQLTGFGLVGQDSSSDYTPFDSTNTGVTAEQQTSTTNQQAQAYTSITATSIANNINGITQYQWGQTGLTTQAGSVVEDTNTSSSTTTGQDTSGSSPNDGYSSPQTAIKDILSTAATAQASKSGQDSS